MLKDQAGGCWNPPAGRFRNLCTVNAKCWLAGSGDAPQFPVKRKSIKTIDPVELEARIARGDPYELIDVRPRADFRKIHVPGARSIPLAEFRAKKVLRERTLGASEPLYVICRDKALSELAAESLQAEGCENAIMVKGGIKAWTQHGLPVVRRECWCISSSGSHAVAVLASVAIGLGLLVHEFFFLVALLVMAWWAIPSILRWGRALVEDLRLAASQLRHRRL